MTSRLRLSTHLFRGVLPEARTLATIHGRRSRPRRSFGALVTLPLIAPLLLGPASAQARSAGAPFTGCSGCHGIENNPPALSLSFDSEILEPAQTVTVNLTIRHELMTRAGFFITTEGLGTLAVLGNETRLAGDDITHAMPQAASNDEVVFSFLWTLPDTPGGGAFQAYAVAANGDNRSQGDFPGSAQFPVAWGCEMVELYADLDRDGFGSKNHGVSGGCEERLGWASRDGDCNENDPGVNPEAIEVCNERDDNCDGSVDEGTTPRPLFPDLDADGYGVPSEDVLMGCLPPAGYSEFDTDCDDDDAERYPGAAEVCDDKDNDCDFRVDEDVQQRCGIGWCQRVAPSCALDVCFPGEPRAEECNAFDDDCDGVIDNDASGCEAELVCYLGQCLLPDDAETLAELPDDGAGMLPPAAPATEGSQPDMDTAGTPGPSTPVEPAPPHEATPVDSDLNPDLESPSPGNGATSQPPLVETRAQSAGSSSCGLTQRPQHGALGGFGFVLVAAFRRRRAVAR